MDRIVFLQIGTSYWMNTIRLCELVYVTEYRARTDVNDMALIQVGITARLNVLIIKNDQSYLLIFSRNLLTR